MRWVVAILLALVALVALASIARADEPAAAGERGGDDAPSPSPSTAPEEGDPGRTVTDRSRLALRIVEDRP